MTKHMSKSGQYPRAALNLAKYVDTITANAALELASHQKIFSDARKIMEANNAKRNYPNLHLYCDWLNHPKLDRKIKFLIELSHALERTAHGDPGRAINAINSFLNFEELRKELKSLFETFQIDCSFVLKRCIWDRILVNVIDDLLDHPIVLDDIYDANGKTVYSAVCKKIPKPDQFKVVDFRLISEGSDLKWRARIESAGTTTSRDAGAYLVGPLYRPVL